MVFRTKRGCKMMLRHSWVALLCVLAVTGQGPPPPNPAMYGAAVPGATHPAVGAAAVPAAAVPPAAHFPGYAPMPNAWAAGAATAPAMVPAGQFGFGPCGSIPATPSPGAQPPAHSPAPLGFGQAHGDLAMGGGMMGMAVSPFAPSAQGPPCFAYELHSRFLVVAFASDTVKN